MSKFFATAVLVSLGLVFPAQANIVNIIWQGPLVPGGLAVGSNLLVGGAAPGCVAVLGINGACANDPVANVGVDPTAVNVPAIGAPSVVTDQFTVSLNSTSVDLAGFWGFETLTATVTDVLGGAGSIELDSLQQYSLAAAFPLLIGYGTLNGNCNANTIAGDSISATVSLDAVVAPALTLNCPAGGTVGNVIVGPTTTGLVLNNAVVAEFDIGALFTFAAGTPAGASESIPVSLEDAPEPATFGLMAGALVAIGAVVRRRGFIAK